MYGLFDSKTGTSMERLDTKEMTTRSVYKSLIVFSAAFMFLFSAGTSFQNIQSTVNIKEGLGTTSLAVLYITMVLTNLFVTLFTLPLLSYKWVTVISMSAFTAVFATGFYFSWETLIPACIIAGIGAAHAWPTMQAYVTQLAVIHSTNTLVSRERTLTLFFGIFMGIFHTSQIWGNLASSLVFGSSATDPGNTTESDADISMCGADFCPAIAAGNNTIALPPTRTVYVFSALCVGMGLIATLLVGTLATNVPFQGSSAVVAEESQHRCKVCGIRVTGVFRHIMTSPFQRLLVPVSVLSGMTTGFVAGDITVGYVSCPYGVDNIGYVMVAYGTMTSVSAFLVGTLSAFLGSLAVIIIGMSCEVTALLALLLWSPGAEQIAVVFILAGLCGVADGIFHPVIMSLYSEYFIEDIDSLGASFSSYRLLNSVGWAVSFAYSSHLCMRAKIVILLSVIVVSGGCLCIIHFRHKAEKDNKQLNNHNTINIEKCELVAK